MHRFPKTFCTALILGGLLTGCAKPTAPVTPSVPAGTGHITVTWAPNRETAVNTTGGGYRVYYSTTSGFSIGSATSVNVPYVSGASAPVTATIPSLAAGTYFIKVVAYSALRSGSQSDASAETAAVVP